MSTPNVFDVVFDGPPGPNAQGHHCNFVEVEDATGASIRVGKWIDRGDGLWALRIQRLSEWTRFRRYLYILAFRLGGITVTPACGDRRITTQPFFNATGNDSDWHEMFERSMAT